MSEPTRPEGEIGKSEPVDSPVERTSGMDTKDTGMARHWKTLRYTYTPRGGERPSDDPSFSAKMRELHSVDHMRPLMDKLLVDSMDAPAREEIDKYRDTLGERFAFTMPDGTPMNLGERLVVLENALVEAENGILVHETELLTKGVEFNDLEHRKALVLLNQVRIELEALLSDPAEEATQVLRTNETNPEAQAAGMQREEEIADLEKQLSMEAPSDIPDAEKRDPQD